MTPPSPRPRGLGKKIALVCAGGSFTSFFLSFGLGLWAMNEYGKHVYTGSLFATAFFFFSAAVVLYEMSRPQQPLPQQPPADPQP